MLCGCCFAYLHLCTAFVGNSQVWFGMFMWDSHQPPSSKKILECPSENCIPHPNRSFFLRGFWVKRRRVAALAFPVLLVDEKEPTIHGDCSNYFFLNISQGSPIHFAWYLSNQILGAWSCLNIHRVSSTQGTPRPWEVVQNDFGGLCLWKIKSSIGFLSCPDKNRKS